MKLRMHQRDQGIGIAVVLLALMVLGSVAGAMILISSGHIITANSSHQGQEALYAARAGAYIKMGQVRSGDLSKYEGKMPRPGLSYETVVFEGPDAARGIPEDCFLVESTGILSEYPSGKVLRSRKMSVLFNTSASRWSHAAFGNSLVEMKAGSYTDSYNSDFPNMPYDDLDHTLATIATNKEKDGIKIEDPDKVVIGWDGSFDVVTKKRKKKKSSDEVVLTPHADVLGPPGSVEGMVVKDASKSNKAYKHFRTNSQTTNMDPVVMPSNLVVHQDIGVIDPDVSPFPSVEVQTVEMLRPGAYHDLIIDGLGKQAVLDVSEATPGSTVEYTFRRIEIEDGMLSVRQPLPTAENPNPEPVTVKVFIDTGTGKNVDKDAGLYMEGSSILNPSTKPIHLQFLIAGQGESVLEGGDSEDDLSPAAYYVAYAPEATIKIKEGALYGAVVADRVILEGDSDALKTLEKTPAVIHYDVTLLDDAENQPTFNILSIRYH